MISRPAQLHDARHTHTQNSNAAQTEQTRWISLRAGAALEVVLIPHSPPLCVLDFALFRGACPAVDGLPRVRRVQNNVQVREASVGNPADFGYYDWHGAPDIAEYITNPDGEVPFTVDTYCEEAVLDRRGSLQLSRWGLPTTKPTNKHTTMFRTCLLCPKIDDMISVPNLRRGVF